MAATGALNAYNILGADLDKVIDLYRNDLNTGNVRYAHAW